LDEIKRLSVTHPEIVLCGVNLGLYGEDLHPRMNLYTLVKEILEIPSLERLRLSSLEPNLIDDELISLLRHKKICPHLHLPFQSGDDSVLRAMNKKETVALYETLIEKIRAIRPSTAISCDVMVGFPAENEETFKNTVNFLKRVRPMRMHIFVFSPREKTKFASATPRNSARITARAKSLKELASTFTAGYNNMFRGAVLHMATEEKKGHYTYGYTENYIRVCVRKELPLGRIIPVRIEEIDGRQGVFASISHATK
ncbi:MAG: radical SAM protein, partial [Candidatus Omnitrophica bacterium]|nr:radical SAM protein [Candidatus Omnitrophota bacterium]